MNSVKIFGLIALVTFWGNEARAQSAAPELSVTQALLWAEEASPALKAARAREAQAQEAVKIAQAAYYPTFDLEAIQSYGFAGSNGALGLGGLMSSPFRGGPTVGVFSKMNLIDFGRSFNVEAAKDRLRATQEDTRLLRYKLDQAALLIFLEGAKYRGEMEAWREINAEIGKVAQEVNKFVQTGQHSEVENLLVADQVQEGAVAQATAEERYRIAVHRLALFTSRQDSDIVFPKPASIEESALPLTPPNAVSPLVTKASAEAEAAKAGASTATAEGYPRISAIASAGAMDKVRLVDRENYSGGFGLTLPIFEGFRISSEIRRSKSAVVEKEDDLLAARLELDELDARYDESINTSRIRLRYLVQEFQSGREALKVAWKRYLSFLGPLVEVREALRNLARIETQTSEVKAELLLAIGSKSLLNGGIVR